MTRASRVYRFIALASLLAVQAFGVSGAPYYHTLVVNGFDRKAKIYVPSNVSAPSPVLFYFHGYSGTVEDSDARRQFQTYWPEA